jgi:hypothetical protein
MARPSTGANLSITQLQQILNDRNSSLKRLEKQRTDLLKKLDGIDRDIEKSAALPVHAARADALTTTRASPRPWTTSSALPASR